MVIDFRFHGNDIFRGSLKSKTRNIFGVILPFGPEPFGNELPSGLSPEFVGIEDKAELLMAEGRPQRLACKMSQ